LNDEATERKGTQVSKLYPRTYTALLLIGHTPDQARQILIAARRGDQFSLISIRTAVQLQRPSQRKRSVIEALLDYDRIVG
jgi:hypothetical protein